MLTVLNSPSVSNSSTWVTAFEAGMASLEREIGNRRDDAAVEFEADEDRRAELECQQRHDETCCLRCGDPTEGIRIGAAIVRVCPACRQPEVTAGKFMTMYV